VYKKSINQSNLTKENLSQDKEDFKKPLIHALNKEEKILARKWHDKLCSSTLILLHVRHFNVSKIGPSFSGPAVAVPLPYTF